MKKAIIIIGLILAVGIYILFFIQKEIVVLWNTNTVAIQVETPLQKNKVRIEYAMSTRFYKDDINFSKNTDYVLIFDGTTTKTTPNNYGENDFIISYEDQYYVPFRHFKTNWRHQHDYIFYFYKKEDTLYVRVTVEGVDDMNFETRMEKMPIKKPSEH